MEGTYGTDGSHMSHESHRPHQSTGKLIPFDHFSGRDRTGTIFRLTGRRVPALVFKAYFDKQEMALKRSGEKDGPATRYRDAGILHQRGK